MKSICSIITKIKYNSNKGITLVELIIVLALISIIMTLTYSLFHFNSQTYRLVDTRVNTQNEFRFMLEYLEKQIGTATRIELLGSEEADVSDGKMIFVNTDDSVGNLVSKEGMVVSKIRNSNLSDLSVEFSISGKNVRVKMEASDGHTIQKEIFPQNTTNIIGTVGNTYSYLKVIPVTTY